MIKSIQSFIEKIHIMIYTSFEMHLDFSHGKVEHYTR